LNAVRVEYTQNEAGISDVRNPNDAKCRLFTSWIISGLDSEGRRTIIFYKH
jgi:hypothetical protein